MAIKLYISSLLEKTYEVIHAYGIHSRDKTVNEFDAKIRIDIYLSGKQLHFDDAQDGIAHIQESLRHTQNVPDGTLHRPDNTLDSLDNVLTTAAYAQHSSEDAQSRVAQISYKITNPKTLADVLDFTVNDNGQYKKNDIEKLNQRIINEAQTATSSFIHEIKLKDAIRSAKTIEERILEGLKASQAIGMLGIEILGANILAIQATPEMSRALETETREKLQQEADQAIYERRNFAVEQERKIKESELNTEIAVEEKQKQIAEKKMESEVQKADNDRKLREMKLEADIAVENQRKQLIEQKTSNDKKEAETQGYVIETTLKPYKDIDWKTLTALSNNSDPKFNISLAFRQLAENADKIGNLNISPELLDSILNSKK